MITRGSKEFLYLEAYMDFEIRADIVTLNENNNSTVLNEWEDQRNV